MDIALDKVCELILRAGAIDVKEGITDPDSGSNPIDDGNLDSLTSSPDDATEEEVREFISGLNDDDKATLVALAWIGRGSFDKAEWEDALREAREQHGPDDTAAYLMGLPLLGDYLAEGMAAFGYSYVEED